MERVMIIGQPGSGKSTLARALGARTGLPVVHIDMIHWEAGWVERSPDEKTRLCREVHARSEWIFEGGHSVTWSERLARADTIIWLDIPLALRLWRVTWRVIQNWNRSRPDLPEGCPERFDLEFYRFIWRTRRRARDRIAKLVADAPPEKRVVVLRSRRAAEAWLADL
ncbi:MAG: AAA family ATPase [Pseudomonadota bacterium]